MKSPAACHLLFLLLLLPHHLTLVAAEGAAGDGHPDAATGEREDPQQPQDHKETTEDPLSSSLRATEEEVTGVPESDIASNLEGTWDFQYEDLQVPVEGSVPLVDNILKEENDVNADDRDPSLDAIMLFIDEFIGKPDESEPPDGVEDKVYSEPPDGVEDKVYSEPPGGVEDKVYDPRSYHDEVVANLTRQRIGDETVEEDEQRVVSCGGFISLSDEAPVTITTPGYPDNYPADVECVWTIVAQIGTDSDQVHLYLADFDLEEGSCRADSLRIVDNLVGSSMEWCGNKPHQSITSRGNSLTLTFSSDATIERKGFLIRVFGLRSTCGQVVQTLGNDSLVLSTPSFPLPYPVGSRCHWLVLAKAQMALNLVGHHGKLEDQGTLSVSTETFGEYEIYDPEKIYLSDLLTITFTAEHHNALEASQQPGLQFQVVPVARVSSCNTTLVVTNESAAVIASSKYPQGYEPHSQCWWTLRYDLGSDYRATIRMVDFDVEDGEKCLYDYLEVIDEWRASRERLCGEKSGFKYTTDSRELQLYFQSDAYDLGRHRGFLLVAGMERIRSNECTVQKTNNVTLVFASPPPLLHGPTYSVCNFSFSSTDGGRYAVRFIYFSLESSNKCEQGNHLAIEDSGVGKTQYFCGEKTGLSFLTASNFLNFHYQFTGNDPTQRFEIEIREVHDPGCGGNYILLPGQAVKLYTPRKGPLEHDCAWVVQGRDSLLLLDFKNVKTELQVSQTGLHTNIFTYSPRTLHFIDPSKNYMILSREAGITITVSARATHSECGAVVKLGRLPVIVTNHGVVPCSQVITVSNKEKVSSVTSIQYTLLSAGQPSTCSVEVTDREEGAVHELCSEDWKRQYETSSTRLQLNAIGNSKSESNYVLLVAAVTTSCGDTFDVRGRVVVKSRNMEKDATCVYRFVGDGRRMVLDVTTSSRRALSYLRVSTDGSYQTLKDLTLHATTSFETTREFLVVVRPFPRSVSFVIHVVRTAHVSSPCETCIVLRQGSQGVITSPHSPDLATYPAHLSCSVKFEAHDHNRSVVLEVQHLDLPHNTSLDTLSVVKGGKVSVIDPSRVTGLPFTLVLDTPFTIRFRTSTDNEFEGYKIRYEANDCGETVKLKKDLPVTIRSPKSWGLYPTYTRCEWLIEANASSIGDRIKLKVVQFDVHESDQVEVFDSLQSDTPVAVLRGAEEGFTVRSVGHQLRIVFSSDGRHVRSGFVLRVRAVASGCGGDIDTGLARAGTISTLKFNPNTGYCLFRLRPSHGQVVSLTPHKGTSGRRGNKPSSGGGGDPQEEQEVVRVGGECRKGKIVVSTSGVLSKGIKYCVGDAIPTLHSTSDVLLLVEAPSFPPISFSYRVGGCGRDLVEPAGEVTSPNHPKPFVGPLTCVWTSRRSVLVTLTHLDLDPQLDHLVLADATRATTITAAHHPRRVLLEGPGTITFTGGSVGLRTGFQLQYDCVLLQRTWHVGVGSPAVILGWQSGTTEPRAWRVTPSEPGRELTVRVWAAYIPGDLSCVTDFLQVAGAQGGGQRLCGGMVLRTLHLPPHDLTLLLHTNSSSVAAFVATVHLVT